MNLQNQQGQGEEEEGRLPMSRREQIEKFWLRKTDTVVRPNTVAFRNDETNDPVNMIDSAFRSLSEAEQARIRQDHYGGDEPVEESTAFIDEKLQELDGEINLLSDNLKKAYNEAVAQETEKVAAAVAVAAAAERGICTDQKGIKSEEGQPDECANIASKDEANLDSNNGETIARDEEYVRSRSFRLMFLRAEKFNARLASRRITRYFREKKELFGDELLARKIKQADLNESEKELLYSGLTCSTGATDTHGRLIIYACRRFTDDVPVSVDSIRRVALYFYQTILEGHEESQKKGLVLVVDTRGMGLPQPLSERRLYPVQRMLMHALPLRFTCNHLCYDNMAYHFFLRIALVVVPVKMRSIIKTHYESTLHRIFSSLSEYGINMEALPLTAEGEICREAVVRYFDAWRREEEMNESSSSSAQIVWHECATTTAN